MAVFNEDAGRAAGFVFGVLLLGDDAAFVLDALALAGVRSGVAGGELNGADAVPVVRARSGGDSDGTNRAARGEGERAGRMK